MAVVKFSILTLLAGGFCTLLGIGMWMGPQEAPCSAQTGQTTVAAAHSPAPCKSCWSAPSDTASDRDIVATEVGRCDSACEGGVCDPVATSASTEPTAVAASAPVPTVVPRIPAASFGAFSPYGVSDPGFCPPPIVAGPSGANCPSSFPCGPGASCPPSVYSAASVYHVAPSMPQASMSQECPPPAYYAPTPANVYPAPVVSTYATYREVEPRTSDDPSMEMIEAFMEEREKRYEAQIEALEGMMELQLEAQAAMLKAEHEVAMAKLQAEAYVKLAGMEQALREEKALLQLVADGTLPTESLRAILAKNQANGHGSPVQPVSTTAAGCACDKCACGTCTCGTADSSCACTECECEGCACPGCEQAVSTAAPVCAPCEASTCKTSACETKACETSACKASACETSTCGRSGDCKSAETCAACPEECDGCTPAPTSLELIATDCEGNGCTILADGIPVAILDGCTLTAEGLECVGVSQGAEGGCKIMFGQRAAACAKSECKGSECEGGCKAADCTTGKCGSCDKSAAAETTESPFVCEKDGCTLEVHVEDVPFLYDIPYVGRLFKKVGVSEGGHDVAAPVEEAKR